MSIDTQPSLLTVCDVAACDTPVAPGQGVCVGCMTLFGPYLQEADRPPTVIDHQPCGHSWWWHNATLDDCDRCHRRRGPEAAADLEHYLNLRAIGLTP